MVFGWVEEGFEFVKTQEILHGDIFAFKDLFLQKLISKQIGVVEVELELFSNSLNSVLGWVDQGAIHGFHKWLLILVNNKFSSQI